MSAQRRYLLGPAILAVLLIVAVNWRCSRSDRGAGGKARSTTAASQAASQGATAARSRAGGPVTFVVLPPELPRDQAGSADAVGLFCDLLAQRLSRAPGVAVVDRSRLDRILAERAAAPAEPSPMLSYDAMIRVGLEGRPGDAAIVVSVVDLSLGNLRARQAWPWRAEPDGNALSQAADLCAATGKALPADTGRFKVRVIHVLAPGRTARLKPLGDDLAFKLNGELDGTKGLRMVHHLEPVSAKEESLFLLMGLSRMPGGRRFLPQADLTLELRVLEHDAVGKTFAQTPIELQCALNWAAPKAAANVSVRGLAGEPDKLAADLRSALEAHLAGLSGAGEEDDFALRRSQAKAELKRADVWNKPGVTSLEPPRLKELAEIAATAAKLDPTYEEAAFQAARMEFLYEAQTGDGADRSSALRQVLGYLKRSDSLPARRHELMKLVNGTLGDWNSTQYPPPAQKDLPPKYTCGYWRAGGPARREPVEALRDLLDAALAQPVARCPHMDYVWLIPVTYFGMLDSGLDARESRQWRDRANDQARDRILALLGQADGNEWAVYRLAGQGIYTVWRNLCRHQSLAMHWAQAEKGLPAARQLLEDFIAAVPAPGRIATAWDYDLYTWLDQFRDADLESRYRRWQRSNAPATQPAPPPEVRPLMVKWPSPKRDPLPADGNFSVPNRTRYVLEGQSQSNVTWLPLARLAGRAYVLCWDNKRQAPRPVLGWFDPNEAQAGGDADAPQRIIRPAADYEKPGEDLVLTCFAADANRILFGSARHGLLRYSPKADRWTRHGAKEGLPILNVEGICPLSEGVFVCSGMESIPDPEHRGNDHNELATYALDSTSGQVKLLHRAVGDGKVQAVGRPVLAWASGGIWNVLGTSLLIRGALSERPALEPWLSEQAPWAHRVETSKPRWAEPGPLPGNPWSGAETTMPNGSVVAAAKVRGGVLAQSTRGLLLLDEDGKLVRLVRGGAGTTVRQIRGPAGCPDNTGAMHAGDIPVEGGFSLRGGQGDWAVFESEERMLLYNAKDRAWYGPVTCERRQWAPGVAFSGCVLAEDDLFLPGRMLKLSEIVAAARGAGRVFTEEQSRRRQLERHLEVPEKDAAFYAFMFGEFAQAEASLEALLAKDQRNPELLVVTGILHDRPYLNQPAEALRYYQRLVSLEGNPPARLRGLRLCYFTCFREGRYAEAAGVEQKLRQEFYSRVQPGYMYYSLPLAKSLAAELKKQAQTVPVR